MENPSESRSRRLEDYVLGACAAPAEGDLPAFLEKFRQEGGSALLAVIYYGSCFSGAGRHASSMYDFFLVVENYRAFHRSAFHALLNVVVPPNLYHLRMPDPAHPGRTLSAKYNVIRLDRLEQETGFDAHDHYFIGRLCQRTGVLWVRDEEVRRRLARCTLEAARRSAAIALPSMEPVREFSVRDFVTKFLEISYASDTRIEGRRKVEAIWNAAPDFYETLFGGVLEELTEGERPSLAGAGGGKYRSVLSEDARRGLEERDRAFLRRSKWKTIPRWAKHLLTFREPVQYLLSKYERHAGHPLELTPLQQRWPLIFGWPALFRALRERLPEAGGSAGPALEKPKDEK
ncbi:MAG: hypothetical protein AB1405_15895 [Bdellovibrionota bacterium]